MSSRVASASAARAVARGRSRAGAPPASTRLASRLPRRSPPARHRGATHVARVAEKGKEPGFVSEEEREYREMMRLTKEWMDYDPDAMPESYPAPWETHVKTLMEEGPWPCWDPSLPESHFEPEPEYVPFVEAPGAYSKFDDKAKIYENQLKAERAELTAKRQAEIRERPWMSMDGDLRLKDIPSCDETGWSHSKILELINYPDDVRAKMEEHSVLVYDPRFPIDNRWIPPPEPDTWEFIQSIGHAESEDSQGGAENCDALAEEYGIPQRITDSPSDGGEELLSRASEQKLARAIDIGEEDEDEDDEEDEDEDEDEEK